MRDLFIVARHETALYEYLVDHFRQNADVHVILDRRTERKHDVPGANRRRQSMTDQDLRELGFAVVQTAGTSKSQVAAISPFALPGPAPSARAPGSLPGA